MGPLARRRGEEREPLWGRESSLTLSQRNASLHEGWDGESGCRQGGTPWGYSLGHARMRGVGGTSRWPEPGHTPEVCLLLWVGASEGTPWSTGVGLGLVEHQGAPPMQQEPWRQPRAGGAWAEGRVIACNFFKVLISVVVFFYK